MFRELSNDKRQKIIIRESLKIIYGDEELDFVLFVNNLLIFKGGKELRVTRVSVR